MRRRGFTSVVQRPAHEGERGAFTLVEPVVRGRRREAFTLVELLVVIGVIGVLVALLLPAIAGARRQAALLACSSNLRQITMASLLHAQEHRGYLPLAGELVAAPMWGYGPDTLSAALSDSQRKRYSYASASELNRMYLPVPLPAALAPYMGYKKLPYDDWGKLDQALNEIEFWRRFMCAATDSHAKPRATNNPNDLTLVGQGQMLSIANEGGMPYAAWSTNSDFAFNEGVFGYHTNARYNTRRYNGNLSRLRKTDQLVLYTDAKPSASPAYYFMRDGWICWRPGLETSGPVSLADAFTDTGRATSKDMFDLPRHRNRINVAFGDGHVQTLDLNATSLQRAYLLPP